MMETFNNNGVDYNIELFAGQITWKVHKMNYKINMFKFSQDNQIASAICEYSSTVNNKDLLIESGLTEQEADDILFERAYEIKGTVDFVPVSLADPGITETDLKKWVNLIMKKHFNFEPYEIIL